MDAHSLLSPVRAPTELADERSAISAELSDATSAMSSNQLGSSLRPLREDCAKKLKVGSLQCGLINLLH